MPLKAQITEDMKSALRAGEKERLGTIRLLLAAVKQREIDERRELSDADVLQVVERLIKQRREAAAQFASGGRADLESKELNEARVLAGYLPAQLSDAEILGLIDEAVAAASATSMKDMGRVMNALRPKVRGRADLAMISNLVKSRLTG
jgi:uncharacterized protein YqeY